MSAEPAYVLSPADVSRIRSYVQTKYAAMPKEQHAEIVADAARRIIEKQLPEFEAGLKKQLTAELIRRTVLEQQRAVVADDIYAVCMELDHEDDRIAEPLAAWIRERSASLTPVRLHTARNGQPAVSTASGAHTAEIIPLPQRNVHERLQSQRKLKLYVYGFLSVLVVASTLLYGWSLRSEKEERQVTDPSVIMPAEPPVPVAEFPVNGLPPELTFTAVDRAALIDYLNAKDSILADPPYMEAIMNVAQEFNIHPILLFAITGQEQAFVPRTHKQAETIANNPFNVFHSWKDYNTTIEESAAIAARTITRLSKDKPEELDPIVWINREYAEDPNWSRGVRLIFDAMMRHMEAFGPEDGKGEKPN